MTNEINDVVGFVTVVTTSQGLRKGALQVAFAIKRITAKKKRRLRASNNDTDGESVDYNNPYSTSHSATSWCNHS